MAVVFKSSRIGNIEQEIGRHEDGSILRGEYDIYKRIKDDCEKSHLHWYVWYDLNLPIPYRNKSELQIDFLLICEIFPCIFFSKIFLYLYSTIFP